MGDILIKTGTLIAILILIGAGFLTIGLLVPRGHQVVVEYRNIEKCENPCGACIAGLDVLQETFDEIDNARAEINRIKYCSEGSNYQMEVCK